MAALVGLLLSHCTPATETELLEVREVSPLSLSPGRLIQISGDGYDPGRDVRVRLSGDYHRPGQASRAVSLELPGRALSTRLIEARFDQTTLASLGGRGTLRGRVSVLFETASGIGSVVGHSDLLNLDVIPNSADTLDSALERSRVGRRLLEDRGLVLGPGVDALEGLPVVLVTDGGGAQRAGLRAGDRVLSVNGVRLRTAADFVPLPGAEHALLEIERVGEAASFELPMALERGQAEALALDIALPVGLAWCLLFILFLAPTAKIQSAAIARLRPPGGERNQAKSLARRHRVLRSLLAILFLVVFAQLFGPRGPGASISAWPLLLAAIGLRSGEGLFGFRLGLRWTRMKGLLSTFGRGGVLALCLLAASALAGTSGMGALEALQGPLPWQWSMLSTAIGPLLFGLWVAAASPRRLPSPLDKEGVTSGEDDKTPKVRQEPGAATRIADELGTLLLAGISVSLFLGGWSLPVTTPNLALGIGLSKGLFVLKGLVLVSIYRRRQARHARTSWRPVPWIAAMALALGGSAAWILGAPGPVLSSRLAIVASVGAGLWLLTATLGLVRNRAAETRPLHPFL